MSLFKQIELFVTILLVVLLLSILNINFNDMQDFAKNQLYTNAKNTANTLSLSLSSMTEDTALMQTTINAMFDGGYFEEIVLTEQDGTGIYRRTEQVKMEGVPTFFINFVNINPPTAEATISNGWTIFGTLSIKAHPGHMYIKLWNNFKKMCTWFLGLGLIGLLLNHIILKMIMKSLFLIKKQADAIGDNEFIINENIPKTTETKQVVLAMNSMVQKVKSIYDREVETLNKYQELKYKDSLTGLYNRKYFTQQLTHFIQSDDETAVGEVMILFLENIDVNAAAVSHQKLEQFYEKLANIITTSAAPYVGSVAVSLKRSEFALILPACSSTESSEIAEFLHNEINTVISSVPDFQNNVYVSIGIASYTYNDDRKTVLSRVDYALSVAKNKPGNRIDHFKEAEAQIIMGKQEWKHLIESSLLTDDFVLTCQSVLHNETEFQKELFVNLRNTQGGFHKAGYFMPMVINLNLAPELDQYVFNKAAKLLDLMPDVTLALNISSEFLKDRTSFIWFRQFLISVKNHSKRLIFEIPDNTVIQHTDICQDFAGLITGMGFSFGIDNFIMSHDSLHYLQQLKPAYIKINQEYLLDTENATSTDTALNSLLTITDSLGICLVATRIENEKQLNLLKSKNIQYFQGRAVSDIVPMGI